jgi:radical SAM superfamily enzyme YgiQ (UPF0313 family)
MLRVSIINPHEKHFDRMSRIFIMPRYGTIAIATALKNAGYEVRAFSEFIRADIDWNYVYRSDFICFGLMSFCAFRGYSLARQIRENTDAPIIFGGAHPTVLPEECLQHCDYVVRNEGDATIVELLQALSNGKDIGGIAGISYRDSSGRIVHNPKREFIVNLDVPQDVSLLHEYGEVGERHFGKASAKHHMQVIQTSRGCPFNCRFCVAPQELGTKYRTKSIETILKDFENGMAVTKSNLFMIVDNEFTVNRKRTEDVLKAIIKKFGGSLELMVFARTEIGQEPVLLKLMIEAGVKILFLGIESVNEDTLKFYRKGQTLEQVRRNVEKIHSAGIQTMGSTILGSDHDTPDKIRDSAVFFIQNHFNHAHFYSLYEIPTKQRVLGLPQMFPDNRIIHHDWRFFSSAYVVHYPMHMKPSTLQRLIIENYDKFYSRKQRTEDDSLMGTTYGRLAFKLKMIDPEIRLARKYIPFLEEMEDGLYDKNEHLLEDRLPRHDGKDHWKRHIPVDLRDM